MKLWTSLVLFVIFGHLRAAVYLLIASWLLPSSICKDALLKSFLSKIEGQLEGKLDREDLQKLKERIDSKLKKLNANAPKPVVTEEAAAGFRRPYMNFQCISCDRHLMLRPAPAVPSLPVGGALPGVHSSRPYTTYELQQIRKHVRGLGGNNKERFDVTQEREKLQRQLLRLW